jgi:hypothetical protein
MATTEQRKEKAATFQVVKDKTRGWRLSIPATLSDTGKRRQFFYSTSREAEAAAKKWKDQRKEFGQQSLAIAPSLAETAVAAEKLLAPLGVGLLEAVRRFVEVETRLRASVPINDACAAYRAAGVDWSDSQARAYRLRCDKLTEAFSGRMISSITGEELCEHLTVTTGTPSVRNQAVRLVRAFWRWCAKPPRSWCQAEVVEHLETAKTTAGEIGILTPDQARAVMLAAEMYFPECVPAFAVSLFTGLRQAEVERITAGDLKADGIEVPAMSSKTQRRRFIAMPEPLAAWLAAYPPEGDTLTPSDWPRKQRAVRRMAGFRVWSNLVPKLAIVPKLEATPPADAPAWPDNGLRHTAATVAVALGKPLEALIFEHGHSGGTALLKTHYLGAMPKADALTIWQLRPMLRNAEAVKPATMQAI